MRFFFDRCVPIKIARIVSAYASPEHTIRHHDEDIRFTKTTPDTEWIAVLGKDSPAWAVVSGDHRILRNKVEKNALAQAGLTFFYLSKPWQNTAFHDYAWKFLKVWPEIVDTAAQSNSSIFEVNGGKALRVRPA
jgi:hypothetical protein